MKSMFSMGFFSNDVFHDSRLGDVTLDSASYLGALNEAFAKWNSVMAWVNSTPNYQQLLGVQVSNFMNLYTAAQQDSVAAQNVQTAMINSSGAEFTIGDADKGASDNFISEANSLQGIIQSLGAAPAAITTPTVTPPSSDGGIGGLLTSIFGPKKPAPIAPGLPLAPAAPSSPLTTPLLIGGGILAVGLIILAARG